MERECWAMLQTRFTNPYDSLMNLSSSSFSSNPLSSIIQVPSDNPLQLNIKFSPRTVPQQNMDDQECVIYLVCCPLNMAILLLRILFKLMHARWLSKADWTWKKVNDLLNDYNQMKLSSSPELCNGSNGLKRDMSRFYKYLIGIALPNVETSPTLSPEWLTNEIARLI